VSVVDGAPRLGLQIDRVVASVAVDERGATGADAKSGTLGVHVHHGSEALEDVSAQEKGESVALDDRKLDQVGLSGDHGRTLDASVAVERAVVAESVAFVLGRLREELEQAGVLQSVSVVGVPAAAGNRKAAR
jgi:hypothetical protein